jgi:hypothetical protein
LVHKSNRVVHWTPFRKFEKPLKPCPRKGEFLLASLPQFFQLFQRLAGLVDSTKVIDQFFRFDQIFGQGGQMCQAAIE